MNPLVFIFSGSAVFIFVTLMFFVAYKIKRNDIADVAWGPGFLVCSLAALFASRSLSPVGTEINLSTYIALLLESIWALRLAAHIGARNFSHKNEDARYANWRKEWGTTWVWRSYLQVFLLQGVFLYIINLPLLWILSQLSQDIGVWSCLAGTSVWLIGFFFEWLSDRQLRRFKAKPESRGKLMTTGLWAWSRHPNYFGEVVQWWGLALFALPLPMGWLTIISPICITWLILKVSGVPMLESGMRDRPGFKEYSARTSVFFPLPPKR